MSAEQIEREHQCNLARRRLRYRMKISAEKHKAAIRALTARFQADHFVAPVQSGALTRG